MKWIISRYCHDLSYLPKYTNDYVLFDRSPEPLDNAIIVPNLGSDIADKFTYIIDNYDNLPDVAVYTKANLFKYITEEEFEQVKDNKGFTPLLTQHHKTDGKVNFYKDGLYNEVNNYWYLYAHPCQSQESMNQLIDLLGIRFRDYLAFAPGSNYIVPKENILKHSKEFYERLRSFLIWDVYPGEAQIMERSLYYLWL